MSVKREHPKADHFYLYEQYGRHLEAEHDGEYVAIAESGRFVVGTDLHEVLMTARKVLGPGSCVFRIGKKRAVFTLR